MSEKRFGNDSKYWVMDTLIRKVLYSISKFSFLVATVLTIIIFDHFLGYNGLPTINISVNGFSNISTSFEWNNWIFLIYYIIGIVLSVLFIKTKWIVAFIERNGHKKSSSGLNDNNTGGGKNAGDSKNKSWATLIKEFFIGSILIGRVLIFNIFNDALILIIFWSLYVFVLSISPIQFIIYPPYYDFTPFFTAIGMIGIVAGFFQFYINTNQDQVKARIEKHLISYMLTYIRKNITANDFSNHFHNAENDEASVITKFDKFRNNFYRDDLNKLLDYSRGFRGPSLQLHIHNNYTDIDMLSTFKRFEQNPDLDSKDKKILDGMYKKYFLKKYQDFIDVVEQDDFSELKILLLPTISFFDEMDIDLYNLDDVLKKVNEIETSTESKTFVDHYTSFYSNCNFVLMKAVSII